MGSWHVWWLELDFPSPEIAKNSRGVTGSVRCSAVRKPRSDQAAERGRRRVHGLQRQLPRQPQRQGRKVLRAMATKG